MRRKIPSTHALACFEAAARHQSYTRAAEELALTQSAVSRQIAALEAYVGAQLFRRTRHGVALTPAGANYARQTSGLLNALERVTLDVAGLESGGGSLLLGTVPTFATRWLLPRLPQLAQQHPDITIHLETRTRPFIFADSGFDAALFAGTDEQVNGWPGTRSMLLMHEHVAPVCSPALPGYRPGMTPAELAELPLLQQSTRPDAWRRWFESVGVDAPAASRGPRYELFSMTATAAVHGVGLALVPLMLIREELARGELVVASAHVLRADRSYFLVWPIDRPEPRTLMAFRSWLVNETALEEAVSRQPGVSIAESG